MHQLDAEQLDGELADLLREKLASILQNVGGAVNESPSGESSGFSSSGDSVNSASLSLSLPRHALRSVRCEVH